MSIDIALRVARYLQLFQQSAFKPLVAISRLSNLKNVSARDRQMIQEAEAMLGPEPSEMGFIKNLFWGRFRNDLVYPYSWANKEDQAMCDALLTEVEVYLKHRHLSALIDQEKYTPERTIQHLIDLGVMGMTVPEEYGNLEATSYKNTRAIRQALRCWVVCCNDTWPYERQETH